MRGFRLIAILAWSLCASVVHAQPVNSFPVFLGEANDGAGRRIPGSLAFLVRIVSNDGPIQTVDFAEGFDSTTGAPRGILGEMCQRWTSSQNNSVYDQTTPGFLTNVNSQGELSFDSHFLVQPTVIDVVTQPAESGVLFPFGHPFTSTSSVGYGIGRPGFLTNPGIIKAAWTIPPGNQSVQLDAAYVVAGGSVGAVGRVLTNSGWHEFEWGAGVPHLPEAGAMLQICISFCVLKRNRRSRNR